MARKSIEGMEEKVLSYIKEFIQTNQYPPSVREIGNAVGLKSSSSVHRYLLILEEKGLLLRDEDKTRALRMPNDTVTSKIPEEEYSSDSIVVPVIGSVAAGIPITAEENVIDTFPLPTYFAKHGEVFMLKVKGDSMIDAGILSGDYLIVSKTPTASNGEIIVAMLDGEATVKRFYRENGYFRLQPENDAYEPILTNSLTIIGKVRGVIRTNVY